MRRLTDYVLAIRATGAPPAPPGLDTVELAWEPGTDGAGDPADAVLDALEDSGLSWADPNLPVTARWVCSARTARHGTVTPS